MKEKVTSGFVIAAKADESEPDILVDELYPCVCPNCGISKFEEGHEKDIITNEETKSRSTRCWGGFGVARYRFLPHRCKACDTVFAPWKVEKKANVSVIGGYILLIFSLVFAIITFVLAIDDDPFMLFITFVMMIFVAGSVAKIHDDTIREADIEKEIADLLEYEDITDEYLDPDEEETEDLDLATANMSEPKSTMEVFDTLTPEQKAVAYYLMGGAVMTSEEEILAMQHIQDQVQANTAKRMNDIWRLHV